MSEPQPKVSFVTVCFKTPDFIRQLLKGFEDAHLAFSFEYFLVDNAAGDGTGAMVRERFPWVQVMDEQGNVGFGAGNNLAFKRSRGEYVMLINPDLTIFPGELEKLLAFADAHPDIGFFGPRVHNPDRTLQRTFHRFPSVWIPLLRRTFLGRTAWGQRTIDTYLMKDVDPEQTREVDGLFGAAILMRRSALEKIGYFDERFFMYFEDIDLCRRAWEQGIRVVYTPIATVVHYHARESTVRQPWQIFTNRVARVHIKSGLQYFLKYWGKPNPHPVTRPV